MDKEQEKKISDICYEIFQNVITYEDGFQQITDLIKEIVEKQKVSEITS